MISVTSLEVGDFIMYAESGQPRLGVVLRAMTLAEIAVRVPNGDAQGVWVATFGENAGSTGPVMDYGPSIGAPSPESIQVVVKSHRTASDDLGPAVGLAG